METIFRLEDGRPITGTMVWYAMICPRQVWLMAHGITPDPENPQISYGRAINCLFADEIDFSLDGMKVDLFVSARGLVYEIKSSYKFVQATKFQVLYYLYRLKLAGINAKGIIKVPYHRKKLLVVLTNKNVEELLQILKKIKDIVRMDCPPAPRRTKMCSKCGYKDYCWW